MSSVPAPGRFRGIDARALGVALAVFLGTAALLATAPRFESPFATPLHRVLHRVTTALWWELLVLALVVGVAADAARGGALQRALLVAFAVGAGVGVNLGGFAVTGPLPGVPFRVTWAVVVGGVLALLAGAGGHALGRGAVALRKRLA